MQQQIDDQLANLVLSGGIHDGETVKVDLNSEGSALDLETTRLS
jgi:ATP-dependent Clp protease ATP-binding subunit ClpA